MSLHNTSVRGSILNASEVGWVFQQILSKSTKDLLGKSLSLEPLYSSKTDGKDVAVFHSKTDNRGPLATFFQTEDGQVGVLYTDDKRGYLHTMSWNNDDYGAFIARLRRPKNVVDRFLFPVKDAQHFTHGHVNNGPHHGNGDVSIHSNMTKIKSTANVTFGQDVNGWGLLHGKNGNDFDLGTVEVFRVVFDSPGVKGPDKSAWFNYENTERKRAQLRKIIDSHHESFSYPANVALFGNPGAGKSSFVNSLETVLQGYQVQSALVGTGTGSLTRTLNGYDILEKLIFWDTMGFGEGEGAIDKTKLEFILGGFLGNGTVLDEPITPKTPGFCVAPREQDKMQAVVGVLPCTDATNEQALERMRILWELIHTDKERARWVRFFILLTGPDRFDDNVRENGPEAICTSEAIRKIRKSVADKVGVPDSNVLPVWNYVDECELNQGKDILLLMALNQIMSACRNYYRRHPKMNKKGCPTSVQK